MRNRIAAVSGDDPNHLLAVFERTTADDHLRPMLRQPLGNGPPDATARTGDDSDLAGEIE